MSKYVLSTMTSAVSYTHFIYPTPDNPIEREKITIRGGASLPSTRSGFGERTEDHEGTPLWTADGVVTPISEEQYEALKKHPIFLKHQKAGLVKFVGDGLQENHKAIARIARDMSEDGMRQLDKKKLTQRIKVTTLKTDQDEYRI